MDSDLRGDTRDDPATSLKLDFPNLNMKYGIGLKDASQFLRSECCGHSGGCGTLLAVIPVKHLVFALFIVEGL